MQKQLMLGVMISILAVGVTADEVRDHERMI